MLSVSFNPNLNYSNIRPTFGNKITAGSHKAASLLDVLKQEKCREVLSAIEFAKNKGFSCLGAKEKAVAEKNDKNQFLKICDRIMQVRVKNDDGSIKVYELYFQKALNIRQPANVIIRNSKNSAMASTKYA